MPEVQLSEPVSIWRLNAPLLEGPVWVERDQALWFTDIKGHKIHRHDPGNGILTGITVEAPGQIGFVLPFADGGFAAGLQNGLHRFDERDQSFRLIVDPEPNMPGNRLNDGTVDPKGRLWFGTMDDSEAEATGAIYRLGADGNCWRESPNYSITNGPAFSPDGKTCYHVDTLGGIIYACDVSRMGVLSDRRVFATIPNSQGFPDGPTVDSEGCVWIGLYNGWAVRRYSPAGELLETIRFPVSAITKIAFGGPELKTVYATTAAKHLSAGALEREPHAGDLFRFEVEVPGLPATMIAPAT
jgi:sugar lactone lactonase YvrE